MASLFELLDEIKGRPTMFLGWTSEERGRQLQTLEGILHGYELACDRHGIAEPGAAFFPKFGNYLYERYRLGKELGPIGAIRNAAENDDQAWHLFWIYVDEYRKHVEGETGPLPTLLS